MTMTKRDFIRPPGKLTCDIAMRMHKQCFVQDAGSALWVKLAVKTTWSIIVMMNSDVNRNSATWLHVQPAGKLPRGIVMKMKRH